MVAMQRGCECEGGMGGGAQEACSDSSVCLGISSALLDWLCMLAA